MTTRLLTFSNLYPNSRQPGLGLFVQSRLHQLMQGRDYAARVVAPVPWFPLSSSRFGKYSIYADIPENETHDGITVRYPRYLHLPGVGMHTAPFMMAGAGERVARELKVQNFIPDLVDAHYFYPDGVAAVRLAGKLDIPVMVTVRGSDINLIAQYARPLKLMRKSAERCAAIVAVSSALANRMEALGFDGNKIHVIRNGVDLDYFSPRSQVDARKNLGLSGRVLLSVGNLLNLKGHHLIIEALQKMPDTTLLIAGSGPMRENLARQINHLGLESRVRLLGQQTRDQLRELYAAADVLVLASSREGLANVLLEAIASGLPVVATNVGGNAEVVSDPRAGVLTAERTPYSIRESVEQLAASGPDRAETREFAQKFGWDDTCHTLHGLIQRIIGN